MAAGDYKYCLVEFNDGTVIVQGGWLSPDLSHSAWPPTAAKMTGLAYDKYVQSGPITPETHWQFHPVKKIRAFSDDFSKVRIKLKRAEDCSDTDLNTEQEEGEELGPVRRSSRRHLSNKPSLDSSDDDNEEGLTQRFKTTLPKVPMEMAVKDIGKSVVVNPSGKTDFTWGTKFGKQAGDKQDLKTSVDSVQSAHKEHFVLSQFGGGKIQEVRSDTSDKVQGESSVNAVRDQQRDKLHTDSSVKKDGKINPVPNDLSDKVQLESSVNAVRDQQRDKLHDDSSIKKDSKVKPVPNDFSDKVQGESSMNAARDQQRDKLRTDSSAKKDSKIKPVPNDLSDKVQGKSSVHDVRDQRREKIHNDSTAKKDSKIKPETSKEIISNDRKLTAKEQAQELASKLSETDFKAYMIVNVTEMRHQLKEMAVKLACLSMTRSQGPSSAVEGEAHFLDSEEQDPLAGFPATDMQMWADFNAQLKSNKKFSNEVAMKIKDLCSGQVTFGDYVRTALTLVISNALATEFSWGGKRGKQPFVGVFFVKVLNWVISKYTKFPRQQDDLKKVIAAWLRLANQRFGGAKFNEYRKTASTDKSESVAESVLSSKSKDASEPSTLSKRGRTSTPCASPSKTTLSQSPKTSPIKKKTRVHQTLNFDDDDFDMDEYMNASSSPGPGYEKDEADASFEDLES